MYVAVFLRTKFIRCVYLTEIKDQLKYLATLERSDLEALKPVHFYLPGPGFVIGYP